MKRNLLLLGLLVCMNAQAGEVYRSIDAGGKVHYSDTPPMNPDDAQELKVDKEPAPNDDLPYETQRAMKNFPVTLYTFPACGSSCQTARDFLSKRGVPFSEKSLVKQEDLDAYYKDSGDNRFPAATIGKTWLKGFQAARWSDELGFAGYPKSVPNYRLPPPAASAPSQPAQ